jgi:hypothetical protein
MGSGRCRWAFGRGAKRDWRKLSQAHRRGLQPAYVLGESRYGAAQIPNVRDRWGWQYGTRLKRNRKLEQESVRTKGPHRYGHAQGQLRRGGHRVLVVRDGRRYSGTNALTSPTVTSKRLTPVGNSLKRPEASLREASACRLRITLTVRSDSNLL